MTTLFRPFEIIKLIRDGQIRGLLDLMFVPDSRFGNDAGRLVGGLLALDLIHDEDGQGIKPTAKLLDLLRTLDLRALTQLGP